MSKTPPPPFVFKIFRSEEWQALERSGTFDGSADDKRDGFIHLSTEEQLDGTLVKHYAKYDRVVIAKIRTTGLPIEMEVSRADMLFPHLYGTLKREDVASFEERLIS